MDSLKIECFLAVADTQSFSKAADKLFKNQSVISRQVAALEKELDVELFVRGARTVILTPAGRIFERGIRKIAEKYASLLEDTVAAQRGYSGELKIGLHPGNLYLENVIPIVRAFERAHPEICLSFLSAYSGELSRKIDEEQIDLVFWRWEEYSNASRDAIHVLKTQHGLLFARDHPIPERADGQYELTDFRDETFIVLPDRVAPGLGRRLLRMCIESGYAPKMVEASDLEASILMVSMQQGTIAMNDLGYFAHSDAFRFVHVPQLGSSEMSFIWDKRNRNPSLHVFLDFLREYQKTN